MAKAPLLNLGDALLQGAKEPSSAPAVPIMPTSEMPMVLTLDEMAPNPDTGTACGAGLPGFPANRGPARCVHALLLCGPGGKAPDKTQPE